MYAHEGGGEKSNRVQKSAASTGCNPSSRTFPSTACHTMAEPTKAGCVFSPYKRKTGLSLPPFISRRNALPVGVPVVKGHPLTALSASFHSLKKEYNAFELFR